MGLLKSLFGDSSSASPNERSQWLLPYAHALASRLRPAEREDEEGVLEGTSDDGLMWTLRVINRREPDSESPTEYHHLLWQTDSVRLDPLQLVFGTAASDARLWGGLDGINIRADQIERGLDDAIAELERLVGSGASGDAFLNQLGTVKGGSMPAFVERAKPFTLPHPFSPPWHGLALDPNAAARLFTSDVIRRIDACEAIQDAAGGWLRVWVGGPNLRFEAQAVDPAPDSYRHLVDAGLTLARAVARGMSVSVGGT